MARIRKIEITNFRGIQSLTWLPASGINCLIGPGDSGKSTVLDAIDLCVGARRNAQFTDADFFNLNVENPISISLTIGGLDDALKSMEAYGLFLRGFDAATGATEDEPAKELETVLTLNLAVAGDLEPVWALVSDRAKEQNVTRNLTWADRVRLSPTRIGAAPESNLGWRRGSVLNRLTDEKADASAAMVQAARHARETFGDDAGAQLAETLRIVGDTAKDLGIDVGDKVRALLDAHAATFAGGTISLHDEDGVPLRGLGIGSTRLLIAGLQRKASAQSSIILVDELEHGLEPHRIIRFLGSLGAKEKDKDKDPPLQAFMTTHSPVALRELSGDQLFVLREQGAQHEVLNVGTDDDIQGTIRVYPDAFLATSVLICEGASEVGIVRGLDQHLASDYPSLFAQGVALVDCHGGGENEPFKRATAFRKLGYRVAILRDDDKQPTPAIEQAFKDAGCSVFTWQAGRALEDELFSSLSDEGIGALLDYAIELHEKELIDEHIKTASGGKKTLADVQCEILFDTPSPETRAMLGKIARTKKTSWFKTVSRMEHIGRQIVGPEHSGEKLDAAFRSIIIDIFDWTDNA
jgi:predicted ATPase